MPTTSNFGWTTPADTDLVKDGAAAIRTLGNGIDTSLVDLKGGTTGQVLSKASNTDLDYTWVTTDDANAIQNAIVDAKGDLIAASAADTPARLAVGSNGETLVADSSATTGLRYNPLVNQNFAVNGGFDWWQRGTSFTGVSPYYTADRWQGYRDGAVAGATYSRQTANLDGFQYCMRASRDSGNTSTNNVNLAQSFETNDVRKFHGQFATISFWARRGALFSATNNTISVILQTGTGTETAITNGFTSGSNIIDTGFTVTTSWQRFTVTTSATIANTATQLGLLFRFTPVGTAGATDYFEVTGMQLEVGQTATAWKRTGSTLAGELAACQRYYYLHASGNAVAVCIFTNYSATDGVGYVNFPVTMRTAPTLSMVSGTNYYAFERNGGTDYINAATIGYAGVNSCRLINSTEISGTAGQAGLLKNDNAAASVAFSAEL